MGMYLPQTGYSQELIAPFEAASQTAGTFGDATYRPDLDVFTGNTLTNNGASSFTFTRASVALLDTIPALLPTPFTPATQTAGTWTNALIGTEMPYGDTLVIVEPREPGDYHVRFAFADVPLSRETIYTVPDDVQSAIVRTMMFSNSTGSDKTVSLWVAGYLFIPLLTIPHDEPPVGEDFPTLPLEAGDEIEMVASASGVTCFIGGVEEVV